MDDPAGSSDEASMGFDSDESYDSDDEEFPDMKIGWGDDPRLRTLNADLTRILYICTTYLPYADIPFHGARAYTRVKFREGGKEEDFNRTNSVQVRPLEPGFFEYQFCWTQPDETDLEDQYANRFWLFFTTSNPFQRPSVWYASIDLGIDIDNLESGGVFVSTVVGRLRNGEYQEVLSHEETITSAARWEHLLDTVIDPVVRACRLEDEDSEKSTDSEGEEQAAGASDMETD